MRTSQNGIAFIKAFEDFVAYPYDDKRPKLRGAYREWKGEKLRGTLTIGYGHTNAAGGLRIKQGMRLTETEASELLAADLWSVERDVEALVGRNMRGAPLSQHEFDAVVSFHFNCHGLVFESRLSKAARAIIDGDRARYIAEASQWWHTPGAEKGLRKRRAGEAALFTGKDWKPFVP